MRKHKFPNIYITENREWKYVHPWIPALLSYIRSPFVQLLMHKTRLPSPPSTAHQNQLFSCLPLLSSELNIWHLETETPPETETQRKPKVKKGSYCPTPSPFPASSLYDSIPTLTYCCWGHFQSRWWQTCLYGHHVLEQKAHKKDALQAILDACNVEEEKKT